MRIEVEQLLRDVETVPALRQRIVVVAPRRLGNVEFRATDLDPALPRLRRSSFRIGLSRRIQIW
jgi:hypothetical protein